MRDDLSLTEEMITERVRAMVDHAWAKDPTVALHWAGGEEGAGVIGVQYNGYGFNLYLDGFDEPIGMLDLFPRTVELSALERVGRPPWRQNAPQLVIDDPINPDQPALIVRFYQGAAVIDLPSSAQLLSADAQGHSEWVASGDQAHLEPSFEPAAPAISLAALQSMEQIRRLRVSARTGDKP